MLLAELFGSLEHIRSGLLACMSLSEVLGGVLHLLDRWSGLGTGKVVGCFGAGVEFVVGDGDAVLLGG